MKKIMILILVALTSATIYAQKQFIVKDSLTHEVIPYATVFFVQGKGGGTYADEYGKIELPDSVHQIRISHISYNEKYIKTTDILKGELLLSQRTQILKEVIVTNRTYLKKQIGFHKSKSESAHGGATGFLMAVFIPYNSQWQSAPLISNIHATLYKFFLDKQPYNALLRFDLQLPDKNTGAPNGISLTNKDIIYKSKVYKKHLNLNLDSPILFPKEGVFIVVEWISDSKTFKQIETAISLTLTETTCYTWIRRQFKGEKWRNMSNDLGSIRLKETINKGKTSNLCLGLTVLE